MQKVGTHSGPFHADELIGIAILRLWAERAGIGEFELIRSRDPKVLDTCDILVDVGAEHDPARGRFDHHHQGKLLYPGTENPAAAAGLVWSHYGTAMYGSSVAEKVYQSLIRQVDGYDTGSIPCADQYTVSNLLSSFNPQWDGEQDFDAAFRKALLVAEQVLRNEVARAKALVASEDIATEAIAKAKDGVVVLDRFAPVMDSLIDTQSVLLVYPGPGGDCWMVQCVPPKKGSFAQKLPLPEAWAGKRDADLQNLTGVQDAVFCHPGRFICGAGSQEGALALAKLALASQV